MRNVYTAAPASASWIIGYIIDLSCTCLSLLCTPASARAEENPPKHHRPIMVFAGFLLGLVALCPALPRAVAAQLGTDDQVQPDIDYGTFQSPASIVRPRFRYWVNDASMNLSVVAEDIKAIGRMGAGGIELLGYYLYGGSQNYGGQLAAPLQTDWTVYGFGTPAWSRWTLLI